MTDTKKTETELNSAVAVLTKQRNRALDELVLQEVKAQTLQVQIDGLKTIIDTLSNSNAALKKELSNICTTHNELSSKVAALEAENEALKAAATPKARKSPKSTKPKD